jgi:WXG100 family type VII secretion target
MATIHMEVESCRTTATAIGNAKTAMEDQMTNLGSTVSNTVGSAWIAPSATEFQNTYQEWTNSMKQLMEQLATLQQRLNTEIADFEEAASKLA